jgi:hypothetical protein
LVRISLDTEIVYLHRWRQIVPFLTYTRRVRELSIRKSLENLIALYFFFNLFRFKLIYWISNFLELFDL